MPSKLFVCLQFSFQATISKGGGEIRIITVDVEDSEFLL
jgi:hypothetical protein